MTEATIGWGAEMHLHNGTALTELAEIITVSPPNEQTDDVEATHMKSPLKRKEYIGGLIESGTGDFLMNYIPGSPTDILVRAAQTAGTPRPYMIRIPIDEAATEFWEITGDCLVKGYARDNPIGDRKTATMTVRFSGAADEAEGA